MSTEQTRTALMDAAVRLTATSGTRALTARGIAGEAGVNQALVYYHFKGVEPLLHEAYERATLAMLADYADDLSSVASFEELYAVGARLAERARADGSASLLSHVVAAAHTDPAMARMLSQSMRHWQDSLAEAVRRVLDTRGLAGVVDVEALTGSLAASTVGMLTVGSVPGQPLGDPLEGVRGLPPLLDRTMRFVPAALARRIFGGAQG